MPQRRHQTPWTPRPPPHPKRALRRRRALSVLQPLFDPVWGIDTAAAPASLDARRTLGAVITTHGDQDQRPAGLLGNVRQAHEHRRVTLRGLLDAHHAFPMALGVRVGAVGPGTRAESADGRLGCSSQAVLGQALCDGRAEDDLEERRTIRSHQSHRRETQW
jgi:hypothetical protein